ncbi:MAG TPA: hypothetical protein VMH33_04240 [Solirubrobacterales bacterium]|nr:hypothetical protein [Solirubrobacterales bacterium]
MGVLPIVLIVLAMKIPILGLWAFVWWAKQEPEVDYDGDGKEPLRVQPPREPRPDDPRRGPRRRGPHGGGAQALPNPRREPRPGAPRRLPEPLRSR